MRQSPNASTATSPSYPPTTTSSQDSTEADTEHSSSTNVSSITEIDQNILDPIWTDSAFVYLDDVLNETEGTFLDNMTSILSPDPGGWTPSRMSMSIFIFGP